MADNAAQGIKNLQTRLEALDKTLFVTDENWNLLGETITDAMKKSGVSVDNLNKLLNEKLNPKEIRKFFNIIKKEQLEKDIKSLEDAVKGTLQEFEINGEKLVGPQIKAALKMYKDALKELPKSAADAYVYVQKILNKLMGITGKESSASKEWKERTKISNEAAKAERSATDGYIEQTQIIQQLTQALEELRQKRIAAEALPVTGIGKAGVSYKTDKTKANAIAKIDSEIKETQASLDNATLSAQKFEAQLIAMGRLKRVKAMKQALGVEEAEQEIQRVPTAFERVIEQINKKKALNKENFAKQIIDADALVAEAKNAFVKIRAQMPSITKLTWDELQRRANSPTTMGFGSIFAREAMGKKDVWDKASLDAIQKYQIAIQKILDLQDKMEANQRKYAANASAVEGVTRRYNNNEQAIQKLIEKWEELNVKKQAGLVTDKDFQSNSQKILDDYDRLIAKRKEFETEDLGRMSLQRQNKQMQAEEAAAKQQQQAAKESAKILTIEKGITAQKKAQSDPRLNTAVEKQLQYLQQIKAIGKDINTLQSNKSRSAEENALLAKRKKELQGILDKQKELNNQQKGSAVLARQIDAANKYKGIIQETTNEIGKQKSNFEKMLPVVQRLASAFGIAFSVRGLAQFGKKLIETRGEFEMQFVAMKQIIGDMDAATKIWNQTMQQALQSPFKAMQLVTYTKQLAAYRIETEKLYDTTRRLADISAGLGVEMSRLILAYGQVKTANYLRASEVRQFTEAGVNIAGNLAKYFTEIEGRAVSTVEVMERITKRMVLFSDVEAIFKRMTDEGGEFFNMQEVQANTVKGQIMKLHDAYDQMLNTIGQANQGTIRDLVTLLNTLVRNWQNVAFVLKTNVNWISLFTGALYMLSSKYLKTATTQTLWFGKALLGNDKVLLKNVADVKLFSKVVGDFTLKQRAAIVVTRTFQGALSAVGNVIKTIWPFIVVEGLVVLIERLTRANRELKRFRKELESVASENAERMQEEINGYGSLIEKLKKTNEGTMARKEVLDEISRRYGKYLDFIITETTSIEDLANAYDKVVLSIRTYTAEKIREEQQQKLEKSMYDEYQRLVSSLENARFWDATGIMHRITDQQASNIAKLVQQSLEKYGFANIQEILEKYFGESYKYAFGTAGENQGLINKINSYVSAWEKIKGKLDKIRTDITTPLFATDKEFEEYKANLTLANTEIKAQNDLFEEQTKKIKDQYRGKEEQWKIDDKIAALRLENEEKILEIRKKYGLISEGQYKDELARLHGELDSYENDYNVRLAKVMSGMFGETWQTEKKEARDMYNYVVSTQQVVSQGTTQRNKQLKESYKEFKDSLAQFNAQYKAAESSGASKKALDNIQADIDSATLMMRAIEIAAKLRGIDLSDKKTTTTEYKSVSTLISLLKEMNSEYDKLSESAYGFAKAKDKVIEAYTETFKEVFGFLNFDISQFDFTTKQGVADAMDYVIKELDRRNFWGQFGKDGGKKARDAFMKDWSQMAAEVDIVASVTLREDFGKEMEKMFSDYDLTLDLKKLELPTDELVGIFDFNYTTLDMLRKKVDEFYNQQKAEGSDETKLVKQMEGYYKKIDEMEKKELRERLKTYTKYLTEGRNEALKIHLEELKKMAALDELYAQGHYTDTEYKNISNAIRKETNEKLAKNDWEQFKKSDFYITMFEDLEKVSSESIDIMIERLKSLRKSIGDLHPKQVKEVVRALEKLEKVKLQRSPLKSFAKDLKDAMQWRKESDNLAKELETRSKNVEDLTKQQEFQSQVVADLRTEYDKLAENGESEDAKNTKIVLEYEEEVLSDINEQLESEQNNLDNVNQKYNEGYAAQQRVYEGIVKGTQHFNEMASAASTISSEVMDMFDGVSDASKQLAKDIAEIATNVGLLAGDIAKAIASEGTDVSSMIDGIVRTWYIIKGIFSASEHEINWTIEKNTEALQDLETQLDRVKRARDRAWDAHAIVVAERKIENTIYEQIAAYDNLIAAEEDRKNKDEDKIRGWKNERQELFDQLEEERENLLKEFGGVGGQSEFKDMAQGFVDAWKSAFMETGDGLQGLQDHFDEFLNEWFVKQATMRISSKMLEPLFRQIDNAVDQYGGGGTDVLVSELQAVKEKFGAIAPQLSDALERLAGMWGLEGEGGLSGLAAGIQGMTEEQANILEAYWNSVRGYTASIDTNVARIVDLMSGGAGGRNVDTNPQLQQMELIARNTTAIQSLLGSVIKSGHSKGGQGVKVFMD